MHYEQTLRCAGFSGRRRNGTASKVGTCIRGEKAA